MESFEAPPYEEEPYEEFSSWSSFVSQACSVRSQMVAVCGHSLRASYEAVKRVALWSYRLALFLYRWPSASAFLFWLVAVFYFRHSLMASHARVLHQLKNTHWDVTTIRNIHWNATTAVRGGTLLLAESHLLLHELSHLSRVSQFLVTAFAAVLLCSLLRFMTPKKIKRRREQDLFRVACGHFTYANTRYYRDPASNVVYKVEPKGCSVDGGPLVSPKLTCNQKKAISQRVSYDYTFTPLDSLPVAESFMLQSPPPRPEPFGQINKTVVFIAVEVHGASGVRDVPIGVGFRFENWIVTNKHLFYGDPNFLGRNYDEIVLTTYQRDKGGKEVVNRVKVQRPEGISPSTRSGQLITGTWEDQIAFQFPDSLFSRLGLRPLTLKNFVALGEGPIKVYGLSGDAQPEPLIATGAVKMDYDLYPFGSMSHTASTFSGWSGSPIYLVPSVGEPAGLVRVVGVHAGGDPNNGRNIGVSCLAVRDFLSHLVLRTHGPPAVPAELLRGYQATLEAESAENRKKQMAPRYAQDHDPTTLETRYGVTMGTARDYEKFEDEEHETQGDDFYEHTQKGKKHHRGRHERDQDLTEARIRQDAAHAARKVGGNEQDPTEFARGILSFQA